MPFHPCNIHIPAVCNFQHSPCTHTNTRKVGRVTQLSFHSISEPPMFPSHSSRLASAPLVPTDESPFLDGNSDVLGKTMKSIAWLIKLSSIQAHRLSNTICEHSYDSAATNLQQAMEALLSKNVECMNSMLNVVLSDVGYCRDEYSGKLSPFATYDDTVTKMTNNCLVVLDLVR
ncbi:hypothetical protein L1987_86982 [Smallanthus sonchifolius]|uniref:Uncharacterized protein n=1 Tax=Smallanthus sonchifolius TaxID=185202 RepID=A0ACB8Y0Z0_9ASTR|nr:hypothetical protein L1987_86982 [Smallanthus sonchifolius]